MNKLATIALSLLFSASALAEEQNLDPLNSEVTLKVTGYGETHAEAVSDGLARAIEQHSGVSVDTALIHKIALNHHDGELSLTSDTDTKHLRLVKGSVKSYEVLSENCDDKGCESRLSVTFTEYRTDGTDHLRKLAVIPFEGQHKELNEHLTGQLQEVLTQSRKLAVLDRKSSKLYEKEQTFWASDSASIKDKARLGQALGLDYMLLGEVLNIGREAGKGASLTGESQNFLEVRYQLVEVATRQIKWINTVKQRLKLQKLDEASKDMAQQIRDELLEQLYPDSVEAEPSQPVEVNEKSESKIIIPEAGGVIL